MKKIFAILTSLLFIVSVFGVAQTMATILQPLPPESPEYCETEYYKISRDSVKVGETFTISLAPVALGDVEIQGKTVTEITNGIVANGGLPYRIGPVDLINVEYYNNDGTLLYSGLVLPDCGFGFPCWSGLSPPYWTDVAWIKWTFRAVTPGTLNLTNGACGYTETMPILSKDLPFKFFAKLFGFGQKD